VTFGEFYRALSKIAAAGALRLASRITGLGDPIDPAYVRAIVGAYSWYDSSRAERELGYDIPALETSLGDACRDRRSRRRGDPSLAHAHALPRQHRRNEGAGRCLHSRWRAASPLCRQRRDLRPRGPPLERLFAEDQPPSPYRDYGTNKHLAERYVLDRTRDGLIDGTSLRGFRFFGPHPPPRQQKFFAMFRWKRQIVFGNGRNHRSITTTDNLAHAIILAAGRSETYGK
jgi:hypothetical protein